jgi:hypothetical protein
MLGKIPSESNNWRLRKLLAGQLKDCVELFEPKVVYKIHFPIALKLCKDDVAEVRTKAWVNIPAILKTLSKEKAKDYFERVLKEIYKFGESERYVQRQVFVIMCANILNQDLPMFWKHFMPLFIDKQNDKVVNVRIILARYWGVFLSNFVEPDTLVEAEKTETLEEEKIEPEISNLDKYKPQYERLLNEKKFIKMIVRLKNDEKQDVSSQITQKVNFEKLMVFIKQNEHKVEDIDLYEEFDETSIGSHQAEEEIYDPEAEFSADNPNLSVSILSLNSARSIIEEVISNAGEDSEEE